MSLLRRVNSSLTLFALFACVAGCSSSAADGAETQSPEINAPDYQPVNVAAGSLVLYEAQVRTANACRPDVGTPEQREACKTKIAPPPIYRAEGMSCAIQGELAKIKLGTLDDMLEDTADYKKALSVRYVRERVGANALWLMPLFPNNDRWSLPDGCDNLGSPYAVRDYFHASGLLSRACIAQQRDEYSSEPCWANGELDRLVQDAHSRGVKVLLDVALNHFGHNYLSYDNADVALDGQGIADNGGDLARLWSFDRTYDETLLHPEVLDSPAALDRLTARSPKDRDLLASLRGKCGGLEGDALVRSFVAYRLLLPNQRGGFSCTGFLETQAPGFYTGSYHFVPSTGLGDNFTNDWRDVKFLYHHEGNPDHSWTFARNREYFFRILNYWVSRGVDGFRFDHTTDFHGGMGSNEWKYLTTKVNYYAAKRGQARPVYLAEEFMDQQEMNKVMDILTEGYVGDMCGRKGVTKDTAHVEGVLENMGRFRVRDSSLGSASFVDRAFTMTALETHDEPRLSSDTGLDAWTGAGFWGIGATTRSTPMLLMGQELGARYGIGFKRSDFLRARFPGSDDAMGGADALVAYYGRMATERLSGSNRALLSPNHWYLRTRDGGTDTRIFAQAKWSSDANVVLVFHNLWSMDVSNVYGVPDELARRISLSDDTDYRFVDVLSSQQMGGCKKGWEVKRDGIYVAMGSGTRAQWLRLEACR